jgi:hypothetical protein
MVIVAALVIVVGAVLALKRAAPPAGDAGAQAAAPVSAAVPNPHGLPRCSIWGPLHAYLAE